MRLFDEVLAVSELEFTFNLASFPAIPWDDFLLNPRRLRGSDFLMRWSQGRWSEDLLIGAVNGTGKFVAIPYGPSSTAPDDDPRKFELYFEELDKANPAARKRPDLIIVTAESLKSVIFTRAVEELAEDAVGIAHEYGEVDETEPVIRFG